MYRSFRLLLSAGVIAAICMTPVSATISDAELAASVQVKGVLVSGADETALVNDQLVRVGERVGEIEILAIEPGLVHMRLADRGFSMSVGSSSIKQSHYGSGPAVASVFDSQSQAAPEFAPEMLGDAPANASYGPIAPGETLSQIVEMLAPERDERANLMTALYVHNPEAFGDSMNLLYAGAWLSVPDAAATSAFADAGPVVNEPAPVDGVRTLVMPGDTLSEIAARHAIDGITLNQAMLAIFEVNRDSFGDNLNVLYAYELLRLPDSPSWAGHTPRAAQAEVERHASAWRSASSINSTQTVRDGALARIQKNQS